MAYKKLFYLFLLFSISLHAAENGAQERNRSQKPLSFGKRLCLLFTGATLIMSPANGMTQQCDFPKLYGIDSIGNCENAEPHHVDVELEACGGLCINGNARSSMSPLENAIFVGNPVVVTTLLQRGANADRAFNYVFKYHSDPTPWIKLLVENGVDPDGSADLHLLPCSLFSVDGCTPLSLAAYKGDLKSVRLLLQLGADPLKSGVNGLLPRDMTNYFVNRRSGDSREIDRLLGAAERAYGVASKYGFCKSLD